LFLVISVAGSDPDSRSGLIWDILVRRFQIRIRNNNFIPDLTFVNFNWKCSANLRFKTTITGVEQLQSHLLKLCNLSAKHWFLTLPFDISDPEKNKIGLDDVLSIDKGRK
jgi:hypothetical protein